MNTWDVLNSPLVLTVISFIFGGIIASAISAEWQRRSQRHSVRLVLAQEILKTYHLYLRLLKNKNNDNDQEEFDQLHSDMLSKAGMAKVIFGEKVGNRLARLTSKLASIHDLKLQAHESKRRKIEHAYENNMNELYVEGREAIEEIFNVIK